MAHSRVPIFKQRRDNIVAILLVKNLIALDPEDATPLKELVHTCSGGDVSDYCRKVYKMPDTTPMYDLLNEFQKGKGLKVANIFTISLHRLSSSVFTFSSLVHHDSD